MFSAVGEKIMRLFVDETGEGIGCNIAGENIWNLRFADDTTLISKSRTELDDVACSVEHHSEKVGPKINRDFMRFKTNNIRLKCVPPIFGPFIVFHRRRR